MENFVSFLKQGSFGRVFKIANEDVPFYALEIIYKSLGNEINLTREGFF